MFILFALSIEDPLKQKKSPAIPPKMMDLKASIPPSAPKIK